MRALEFIVVLFFVRGGGDARASREALPRSFLAEGVARGHFFGPRSIGAAKRHKCNRGQSTILDRFGVLLCGGIKLIFRQDLLTDPSRSPFFTRSTLDRRMAIDSLFAPTSC